jgi:flavin-dependent dehydrogenase
VNPIHVSGAGPAGLAAALTVHTAGRRAIVHERCATVGHRFHGDFQGLENWTTDGDVLDELSAIGIDPTFEHVPVREAVVFDPRGREHCFRSSRPFFYLLTRGPAKGTLDASLGAQAAARGVELCFNDTRRRLAEGGVVAEGPRGSDAIAVGYVFATTAADGAYGALSDRLAPDGYAYLLVSGGRGTVASCMFRDFHRDRLYLANTLAFFQERVGFAMSETRRFGGVGNFCVPRTARRGGLVFAGEAGGFQDALWGFGLRYAMLSGHLAAQAILAGRPGDYEKLWTKRLKGLLRTGIVNRFLFRNLGDAGYNAFLRFFSRLPDPRGWLGSQYRSSPLKQALYPIAARAVRSRRREIPCVEGLCECTWCRCFRDRAPAERTETPSATAGAAP